jgi:hypothetical protein
MEDYQRAGYAGSAVTTALAFDDAIAELRKPPVLLRLGRDRSTWHVRIGLIDGALYDADLWRACLEGEPPPLPPHSIEAQVKFLRSARTRIERALSTADRARVIACLERVGSARAERYLLATSPPPYPGRNR